MGEVRMTVYRSRTGYVVRVAGVLDYAASLELRLALFGELDDGATDLVLDVSRVRLMDASCVEVLSRVHEHAQERGATFRVDGATGVVLAILEITGTAKAFGVYRGRTGRVDDSTGREVELGTSSPWGADVGGLLSRMAGLPEGDPERVELRRRAIELCLPYTERLARRFAGLGESVADLNQVAVLGLLKAIDGYDPWLNTDFGAYALPTVIGELKRYFRDKGWGVRVPRRLQELRMEINGVRDELTQRLRRAPTISDLSEHLSITEDRIIEAMVAATGYRPISLYAPVGDDDFAPMDWLGDTDAEYDAVELRESVNPMLARLPLRQRQIITMRFYGNMTQSEIGAQLGISQMHVSRLLRHTLDQLRRGLLEEERRD